MNAAALRTGSMAADTWLSGVTGLACYAADASGTDVSAAHLAALAGGRSAFFLAKVPVGDLAQLERFAAAGFRIVDTNVTLECPASQYAGAREPANVHPATPADREGVLDIAATAFHWSRFHRDPRLPRALADKVKRAWAEDCLIGKRGEEVLVLAEEGLPAGFLAVLKAGSAAVIDLVAVHPQRQGRRLGEALTQAFAARWAKRAERLRVGTQLANTAALRLYERLGFRVAEAKYVLHAHVRDGAVIT
jgi:ribosomal protein S18 acetylase RimI-like enzyme